MVVLKNSFSTVYSLRECHGLEIMDSLTVHTLEECGGLQRTNFQQFIPWEGVVVWK